MVSLPRSIRDLDFSRRNRLVLYYFVGLGVVVIVYTIAYNLALSELEGVSQSIFASFEFVVQTMTTTGYGQDSGLWNHPLMFLLVSLTQISGIAIGTPVALAGSGPHAPVAARRAADFATVSDSVAILLNVQQRTGDEDTNHVKRGRSTIQSVAERGELDDEEYESVVIVATDVGSAMMQAVREYDTVCVGLSEKSDLSRAMFGSLAERISQETPGNVGIVRSAGAIDHPAD